MFRRKSGVKGKEERDETIRVQRGGGRLSGRKMRKRMGNGRGRVARDQK